MNREASGSGWKALAIFLAIVLVAAGILIGVFYALGDITFGKEEEQSETEAETVAYAEDGSALESGSTVPMQNVTFRTAQALEPYSDDGTAQSDESYASVTLTATVTPSWATQALSWSVAFNDSASEWATGKTVTDYVTLTPGETALTATVQCLQPFGEQIVVTVSANEFEGVTANCTVDFARRILDFRLYCYETDEFLSNFGSSVALIDMVIPTTFDEFKNSYNNNKGAVWAGRFGYIKSTWGNLENEDLEEPEMSWADPYIAETFQFSDYTVKDMIPMDGPEGALTALCEFQITINTDFWGIFFSHYLSRPGNPVLTYSGLFGENYENFSMGNNPLAPFIKVGNSIIDFEIDPQNMYLDYMSECVNWLQENPDEPLVSITYTFTGKYSTFTKTFSFRYDPETVKMPVSDVTLDEDGIVF